MSDGKMTDDALKAAQARFEAATSARIAAGVGVAFYSEGITKRLAECVEDIPALLEHVTAQAAEMAALRGEVDACHAIMEDVRNIAQEAVGDGANRMTIDAARLMAERINTLRDALRGYTNAYHFEIHPGETLYELRVSPKIHAAAHKVLTPPTAAELRRERDMEHG